MRLDELFEAVRPSILYHGTDPDAAGKIIYQDRLKSSLSATNFSDKIALRPSERNQFGNVEGVSFSRSAAFAKAWTSGDGVVLAFDEQKLKQRHRFVTVDYYRNRREAEEFMIGSLEHMSAYLTGIYMSRATFDDLQETDDNFIEGHKPYELLLSHPLLHVEGGWDAMTGKVLKAA
jgi:hypothetical protein